jgi:ankyrin repeat protein
MKNLLKLLLVSLILPVSMYAQENKLKDELFSSIENGKIETVKKIITKDKSLINSENRLGNPLISAAAVDQTEISKFLIENEVDVNFANAQGNTAIHYASMNGNLDLVKNLANNDANIKAMNNRGRGAIHYSVYSGNIQLFEYLQKNGLDTEPSSFDQSSLLHWACHGGNVDMVKYLLKRDYSLDILDGEGYSVLHWASSGNSMEMLKFLVEEKGMDVKRTNPEGNTVLQSAAFGRNIEGIKYFLTKGFEIDEKFENGESLMHLAGGIGDVEFIKFLLENGADVNATDKQGSTALNNAAFSGNVDVVGLLMDNGAVLAPSICAESACASSITPLHQAVWRAPNVVEYFIKRGVDINILDNKHKSALHEAFAGDSIRSIKLLCDAKINLNHKDKNGMTALHVGAKRGKVEGTQLLMKYNPEVNITDISGRTPLHYAAIKGNNEIIDLLLKNNSDINIKDINGNSSLDLAKYYGNNKSAKVLAAKGAKSFNKSKSLFKKDLAIGESAIWYLDHSGYAIKTKNNLLIFDYWEQEPLPINGSLNNGYVNPDEIKNMNVTVFVSHTHQDHFSPVIFEWNNKIEKINYVLGFEHDRDVEYTYIPARETKMLKGIKITPVVSNDSGQGFYVEVDGVTIFHPGDHTNISRDMCPNYTGDVKFLADMYKHTDIAFFPVTGCRFQDKVALNMGTEFALKTIQPVLALPMHGSNNEYEYKKVAEEFNKKLDINSFKYPLNRGDRFYYKSKDLSLAKSN